MYSFKILENTKTLYTSLTINVYIYCKNEREMVAWNFSANWSKDSDQIT